MAALSRLRRETGERRLHRQCNGCEKSALNDLQVLIMRGCMHCTVLCSFQRGLKRKSLGLIKKLRKAVRSESIIST